MIVSGWGRYPKVGGAMIGVRCPDDVRRAFLEGRSMIARGNGRSYGDAALNADRMLSLRSLDRFIDFDAGSGRVECEAGVLLSDLLALAVPRGWFPPVVPGTKQVTVGGMIAADIHGKNHHQAGSIGRYVENLNLCLPNGDTVTCSRRSDAELFEATLGGMGLTGIILSARIKLKPVASAYVRQRVRKLSNLEETLVLFAEQDQATYSVAWIDCLARGRARGRSVFLSGEHAAAAELPKSLQGMPFRFRQRRSLTIPVDAPPGLLNSWSIRVFNTIYYLLNRPIEQLIDYDRFFFPLDALGNWNRLYGRNGFLQYQCLVFVSN